MLIQIYGTDCLAPTMAEYCELFLIKYGSDMSGLYEGGAERVYKYLLRKLHLVTRKLLSWQKHSVQNQRKFTHVHQLPSSL